MKLGELKHLRYCVELLASDNGGRCVEHLDACVVWPNDHEKLLTAESCAAQLIGTKVWEWLPKPSNQWIGPHEREELEGDALEQFVCGEHSLNLRLLDQLGNRGGALNDFLKDAFDGNLTGELFR